jgi:hypothetical protein
MVADWRVLERRVDAAVDLQFADTVVLLPWARGTEIYLPGEEGPDTTRKRRVVKGILVTPGAALVGEGGSSGGGSGGGFSAQVLQSEIWLSITTDELGGDILLPNYDRVFWPKSGELFSISYLEISSTIVPTFISSAPTMSHWRGIPIVASPGVGNMFSTPELFQFYRAKARRHLVEDVTWPHSPSSACLCSSRPQG